MSPRLRRALIAGFLGLAAGIVVLSLRPSGLSVQGRSFRSWMTAARRSSGDLRWVLARTGPRAIPELAGLHDWSEPPWASWVRTRAAGSPGPVGNWFGRMARRPEADVRSDALYGLRLFGDEAVGELPWLLSLAANPQDPRWGDALTSVLDIAPLDPRVRDLTRRWLADADPAVRRRAARSVQTARASAPEFVAPLRNLLDEDSVTREVALLALARIGAPAAEAAPDVVRFLGDPVHGRTAERTLVALGGDAVVPVLPSVYRLALTNLPPPFLVLAAAGTRAAPALALVRSYRTNSDALVRVESAWAEGALRGDPGVVVEGLLTVLRDREAMSDRGFLPRAEPFDAEGGLFSLDPRQAAAWFLGELGPEARTARTALRAIVETEELHLALLGARALIRMGEPVETCLPVLRRGLAAEDPFARRLAAVLARDLGPGARPLRPELEAALSTEMLTRRFAREALGRLEGSGGSITP